VRPMVPADADQVPRLDRFKAAHPGVVIHAGEGYWQARIPEQDGETVITRYLLGALLDVLDGLPVPDG
jgi:hypothetical protein